MIGLPIHAIGVGVVCKTGTIRACLFFVGDGYHAVPDVISDRWRETVAGSPHDKDLSSQETKVIMDPG